jgi:hypothetical protein
MTSPTTPSPTPGRVTVHLPANLQAVYANFAVITHSPSEVVVDLAQVMPQVPQARVQARVIMTPLNAKLLLRALTDNLSRYEAQFGAIDVPEGTTLADHLFHPPSADPPSEE